MNEAPTLAELLREPLLGHETAFEIVRDLDEETPKLAMSLRKLRAEAPEEAPLAKSHRRAHTFFAVSGFLAYLAKYGGPHTVILADPAEQRVQAVLDETADAGGREVVTFQPQVHPRWRPFRDLLGKVMPLRELLAFVRDNRRAIRGGRALVFTLSQVTCSTEVTLHQGSGQDSVNGLLIKTKIQGGGTQPTPVALPESIKVATPIWVDTEPSEIELDLVVEGARAGDAIVARFSSADLREAEIQAFDAVVEKIRSEAAEGTCVTHGTHQEQPWARVRG